MKKARFTEEQLVAIPRGADGSAVAEVTKRDAPALDAIRRIAGTYPRFGYRRVPIFLRCERPA